MRTFITRVLPMAAALFTLIPASTQAQNAPPNQAPQPGAAAAAPAGGSGRAGGRGGFGRGPALRSPEVSADGRVTFRLRAPSAKVVEVSGIGRERLPMEKNDQGVWTATTGSLKPDVYFYSFVVDGDSFNDPADTRFKSNFGTGGQSMVVVSGDSLWGVRPGVARGAVTHHFYHSSVAGDDRDYWVYTPAAYEPKRKEPYPTLYLAHGLGDDSNAWFDTGQANVILDNLIAEGKARPMVVVTPLGYGNSGGPSTAMAQDMLPNYEKALLGEVIPRVEKDYNVSKNRLDRAIAGLSMGGAEATLTGLNHLDRFAWIGSFSGAYVMWPRESAGRGAGTPGASPAAAAPAAPAGQPGAAGASGRGGRGGGRGGGQALNPADIARNFPSLDAKDNSQIRLFWISCGSDDGLLGVNKQFMDYMQSKGVTFTFKEYPNMAHVWPVWRDSLATLAPLLFQPKAK